jgi:hypothetical protein
VQFGFMQGVSSFLKDFESEIEIRLPIARRKVGGRRKTFLRGNTISSGRSGHIRTIKSVADLGRSFQMDRQFLEELDLISEILRVKIQVHDSESTPSESQSKLFYEGDSQFIQTRLRMPKKSDSFMRVVCNYPI